MLDLDAPDDDQQADLDSDDDDDGGPRGREDAVLDATHDLGADDESVGRGMIFGRATAHGTSMKQAEYALEGLTDKGAVYQPPEGNDNEWIVSG